MKVHLQRYRIPQTFAGNLRFLTDPGFGRVQCVLAYHVNNGTDLNVGDVSTNSKCILVGHAGTSGSSTAPTTIMVSAGIAHSNNLASTQTQVGTRNSDWASGDSNRATRYRFTGIVLGVDEITLTNSGKASTGTTFDDLILVMFGGTGLSSATNYNQLNQTLNATRNITGLTFQPDVVIGSWCMDTAGNTSVAGNSKFGYGAHARTNNSMPAYIVYGAENGVLNVTAKAGIGTDMLYKRLSAVGTATGTLSAASGGGITAFNADGFNVQTLNSAQAAATYQFNFTALKCDERIKTGYFFTPTGSGSTFIDIGFVPQFVMGATSGSSVMGSQPETNLESPGVNLWFSQGSTTSKFIEGKGTITSSTGSITITGTGSSFLAQVSQGDLIYGPTYNLLGTVAGVASTTSLTLTANSLVNLTTQSYFITGSKNYTLYFGDVVDAPEQEAFVGIATSSPNLHIGSGTAVSAIISGQIITLCDNGFQINYTNTFSTARLNWYMAIEAEPREKRRQSGY
jgi:hypothetical protein